MATDVCAGVRAQFLPLPQGTQRSSPSSQESSLANKQDSGLGEDAPCPSCPSCVTQQKGIHGARGRIQVSWGVLRDSGRGTLELEQGDGRACQFCCCIYVK